LGYPTLRQLLAELGRRLQAKGVILHAEDVYWITRDELWDAIPKLGSGEQPEALLDQVAERRHEREILSDVTPPPTLPHSDTYMGVRVDSFIAATESEQGEDVIKGLGASPGRITGSARVLRGPEEFGQMQPGEILVAGITTPAWTPLFAMAAAVVTDVGGPLSHGSIVAREYGIPAVLGTGVATRRIASGQTITVDGTAGEVILDA
jgi:pyruvate,water dikinase